MARFIKHHVDTMGKTPGYLRFTGVQKVEHTTIEINDFNKEILEEKEISNLDELENYSQPETVTWVNIIGLHDEEKIEKIGVIFDLDYLALEDILNIGQRPKFEEFDHFSLISLKMLRLDTSSNNIIHEQLSIVFGDGFLLTFQEERGDVFSTIRERLMKKTSKIRNRRSDFLAYALVDTIVDNYIYILEHFGDLIERQESLLLSKNRPKDIVNKLYSFKREINYLRKVIRPVRECVVAFGKSENGLLNKTTKPFLNDLLDHVTHGAEVVEIYRDLLSDQLNIYNSEVNNRLNEIIRVLTIFSVIFIPLTFISGVYGTNFKYLPELEYRYAYPIFWVVIIFVASGMWLYFRSKKWL